MKYNSDNKYYRLHIKYLFVDMHYNLLKKNSNHQFSLNLQLQVSFCPTAVTECANLLQFHAL